MFPKHARYITTRVNEIVGSDIQAALWAIIDRDLAELEDLDYLQVFSLSIIHAEGRMFQRIRQKQEQPERKKIHDISSIKEPISGVTIWVLDSGDYCTMLLPKDY